MTMTELTARIFRTASVVQSVVVASIAQWNRLRAHNLDAYAHGQL